MNLHNFQLEVDPLIVGRGKEYFRNNAVEELRQGNNDEWEAVVSGTADYEILIQLNGNEIVEWECDCPYDHGPVCKHVVAVLFAISNEVVDTDSLDVSLSEPALKDQKKDKGNGEKEKKKPAIETEELLERLTNEELRIFLKQQLAKNRDLKNAFFTTFIEKQQGDGLSKYRKVITALVDGLTDRYGYIEYAKAKKLFKQLEDLCKKAKLMLAHKNLVDSLALTKALIEEIPEIIEEAEDSNVDGSEMVDRAIENLRNIISESPPMLRDELFEYLIAEYPKKKYQTSGFDYNFLEILSTLVGTDVQEKIFFNLIDSQIKVEKKNEYSDYEVVNLLKEKCNYLEQNNRGNEADAIVKENIRYPDFRKMLIDDAIEKKQFDESRQLCLDGIVIAEEKGDSGTASFFRKKLLEIAKTEKNVSDIQKWSEFLFFDGAYSMQYYRDFKKTFEILEWPERCEQIINKIKNPEQRGRFEDANVIARIFIEENYLERLLVLVSLNRSKIEFIDSYAKYLQDDYPTEMITLYENAINHLVENTGRDLYNRMADYLKKMQKIKGSQLVVDKMIALYRAKYRNRQAMIEVLDKHFK